MIVQRKMPPIDTIYTGDVLNLEGIRWPLAGEAARLQVHQAKAPGRTVEVCLDARGLKLLEEHARQLRQWIESRS
jgi:hypothetical protein